MTYSVDFVEKNSKKWIRKNILKNEYEGNNTDFITSGFFSQGASSEVKSYYQDYITTFWC